MIKYKLSDKSIDTLSEQIHDLYIACGRTGREATRARLLLEEVLLKYRDNFGKDTVAVFREYKLPGQSRFCLSIREEAYDPFSYEENPSEFLMHSMMNELQGNVPTWNYINRANEIVFSIQKKSEMNPLSKILLAAVLALISGSVVRYNVSTIAVAKVVYNYVIPLSDAYAGLFCVMAVLLTLFAITLSIVNLGDLSTVSEFGGKLIRRFYEMTFIPMLLLCLPVIFSPAQFGGETAPNVEIKTIYDILIGFLPTNLIEPFVEMNSLHIMLIGSMFGFSLLYMGNKGDTLLRVFSECNMVAICTNDFINRFIYIYVFLKTFEVTAIKGMAATEQTVNMIAFILISEAILFLFFGIRGSRAAGMKFTEYFKEMSMPFFVCLATANFGACSTSMTDALEKRKIDTRLANIGMNLGGIIFQPACSLLFASSAVFMAGIYDVNISFSWILIDVLLSILMAAAMPNIPGASVAVLSLLYSQLQLPGNALTFMIAIYAVLQFPTVAVDTWCLQSEIVCLSEDAKNNLLIKKKK